MEGMTEKVDDIIKQMHAKLADVVVLADKGSALPDRVAGLAQQAQTTFDILGECAQQLQEAADRYKVVITALETAGRRLEEAHPEELPERVAQAVSDANAKRLTAIEKEIKQANGSIKTLHEQVQAASDAARNGLQALESGVAAQTEEERTQHAQVHDLLAKVLDTAKDIHCEVQAVETAASRAREAQVQQTKIIVGAIVVAGIIVAGVVLAA